MAERGFDAKVFLEGIEVKFISAHVSETVGESMTSCQVTLPPGRALRKIEPRTLMHVFVRRTSPLGGDEFRCVFEGEVGAFGTNVNAEGSRSFHVVGYSLANYWRFSQLYYFDDAASNVTLTSGSSATEQVNGAESGETPQLSVSETDNQSGVVLSSSIHQNFSGKTFEEGLIDLFKLVFEKDEAKERGYQFIIDANDRLRLVDRLLVSASDAGLFMEEEAFNFYASRLVISRGGYITFESVLSLVLGTIFHDYVVPAAPVRRTAGAGISDERRALIQELIRDPGGSTDVVARLADLEEAEAALAKS